MKYYRIINSCIVIGELQVFWSSCRSGQSQTSSFLKSSRRSCSVNPRGVSRWCRSGTTIDCCVFYVSGCQEPPGKPSYVSFFDAKSPVYLSMKWSRSWSAQLDRFLWPAGCFMWRLMCYQLKLVHVKTSSALEQSVCEHFWNMKDSPQSYQKTSKNVIMNTSLVPKAPWRGFGFVTVLLEKHRSFLAPSLWPLCFFWRLLVKMRVWLHPAACKSVQKNT